MTFSESYCETAEHFKFKFFKKQRGGGGGGGKKGNLQE